MPMDAYRISVGGDVTDHPDREGGRHLRHDHEALVSAILMAAQQLSRQNRNGQASCDSGRSARDGVGDRVDRLAEDQVHHPSTKNRQGNDIGTSYRSAILYTSEEQKRVAEDTIADVDASGLWPGKVVTEVTPAGEFWEAEPEHQDYLQKSHGYTCHFPRPGWKLPKRATAGRLRRADLGVTSTALPQAAQFRRRPVPAFRVIRPVWRSWAGEAAGQGGADGCQVENRLEKRMTG
jgi:hypothetical protein